MSPRTALRLLPLLVFAAPGAALADAADGAEGEISWRTGALLAADQSFFTVGLGLRVKTETAWTFEASADVSLTEGSPLPTSTSGFFGVMPLALTGLYNPLPEAPLSPFLEVGGGLNLLSDQTPEPFLHGGGGAAYQRGAWGVATGLRFLFLPGSSRSDLLDERGLQMTLSLQRNF